MGDVAHSISFTVDLMRYLFYKMGDVARCQNCRLSAVFLLLSYFNYVANRIGTVADYYSYPTVIFKFVFSKSATSLIFFGKYLCAKNVKSQKTADVDGFTLQNIVLIVYISPKPSTSTVLRYA